MNKYILYWMQQSQRIRYNKAFNFAVELANRRNLPLIVCFNLTEFPEAQFAHYRFMIDGIRQVKNELENSGIGFIISAGNMSDNILKLTENAEFLVMDKGYLAIQRMWRKNVSANLKCDFSIIDSDTIIPVTAASPKMEIAARTLRPKINKLLPHYLKPIEEIIPLFNSTKHQLLKFDSSHTILKKYPETKSGFHGNSASAQKTLNNFINNKLHRYHLDSNDPSLENRSQLSPFLHFGQISSLDIALQIKNCSAPEDAKNAFLEQLIVRRELAVNFVWYTHNYDKYENAVPNWAKITLADHATDKRDFLYTMDAFENADTHDQYWNAAQNELLKTGFMHNYMRMYWAKKIIEWTPAPETAFEFALKINNKYQLDSRDPNSFAGIAWTFGMHDHPWKERDIFGKVRYMNAKGLERKFNINKYANKWNPKTSK